MNSIPFPRKDDHGGGQHSEEESKENFLVSYHERNITDGGEFLDDALRMKDQPLDEATVKKDE
ncbi:MAG TPA: hypothetical protein VFI06_03115 [Chitinophagaceae bacterium]|nr:hypothetical protein [Chitinophagaceae bacterium]